MSNPPPTPEFFNQVINDLIYAIDNDAHARISSIMGALEDVTLDEEDRTELVYAAAFRGNIMVLDAFLNTQESEYVLNQALEYAAKGGHLDCLEFLVHRQDLWARGPSVKRIVVGACKSGRMDVLDWMEKQAPGILNATLDDECVQWCAKAGNFGQLHDLITIMHNSCPLTLTLDTALSCTKDTPDEELIQLLIARSTLDHAKSDALVCCLKIDRKDLFAQIWPAAGFINRLNAFLESLKTGRMEFFDWIMSSLPQQHTLDELAQILSDHPLALQNLQRHQAEQQRQQLHEQLNESTTVQSAPRLKM